MTQFPQLACTIVAHLCQNLLQLFDLQIYVVVNLKSKRHLYLLPHRRLLSARSLISWLLLFSLMLLWCFWIAIIILDLLFYVFWYHTIKKSITKLAFCHALRLKCYILELSRYSWFRRIRNFWEESRRYWREEERVKTFPEVFLSLNHIQRNKVL